MQGSPQFGNQLLRAAMSSLAAAADASQALPSGNVQPPVPEPTPAVSGLALPTWGDTDLGARRKTKFLVQWPGAEALSRNGQGAQQLHAQIPPSHPIRNPAPPASSQIVPSRLKAPL